MKTSITYDFGDDDSRSRTFPVLLAWETKDAIDQFLRVLGAEHPTRVTTYGEMEQLLRATFDTHGAAAVLDT